MSDSNTKSGEDTAYEPGSTLANGKYELVEPLREGGMGALWIARNLALDVQVVIKLIRVDLKNAHMAKRLANEAKAAAKIRHPSIVEVYDLGQTEAGEPYIVMEHLDGEDLAERLARKSRLPSLLSVQLLLPIISAVGAAHRAGIIHRDLKPDNIVITPGDDGFEIPKVLDFGVARIRNHAFDQRITQDGAVLGSPAYMAPEQAKGRSDIDERTDIWALCVVLYEMITGRVPFNADNYNALIAAICDDAPRSTVAQLAGDDVLWTIIKKGLHKDPAQRWSTMKELGSALAQWAMDQGAESDAAGQALSRWLSDSDESVVERNVYGRKSLPSVNDSARWAAITLPPSDPAPVGALLQSTAGKVSSAPPSARAPGSEPPTGPGSSDRPSSAPRGTSVTPVGATFSELPREGAGRRGIVIGVVGLVVGIVGAVVVASFTGDLGAEPTPAGSGAQEDATVAGERASAGGAPSDIAPGDPSERPGDASSSASASASGDEGAPGVPSEPHETPEGDAVGTASPTAASVAAKPPPPASSPGTATNAPKGAPPPPAPPPPAPAAPGDLPLPEQATF